ncbi:SDR family oxidoreductase [Vibrio viridaestus]|uniref:SDR family oxidoreductase n=1 Tax=Vibrio viridaestus TaxID=2487322 RepID=A0A3N9TKS3_9VIBR|nr:SDR family oxidoreductase [Vibrio viridaestus]RQW64877.1 SDR family oxidoreductase [Vibrio viridaestus]
MDVKGKVVLLTGATGGIGEQIARQFAEQGAKLILVSRSESKLSQLKNQLASAEQHICMPCDITKTDAISDLDRRIQERVSTSGQRIDIVINNAGSNQFQLLSRREMDNIESEIALNLVAPILISKLAICGWLKQPGIILNIGSTFGGIGYPGYTVYGAAKAGLYRFSEALNRELYGSNIKVLYLAPRATKTSLNSHSVNNLNTELKNHVDLPEYVAKKALHIVEREASCHWLGWPEKLFVRINQLLPNVVSRSIHKQLPVIYRYITAARN